MQGLLYQPYRKENSNQGNSFNLDICVYSLQVFIFLSISTQIFIRKYDATINYQK